MATASIGRAAAARRDTSTAELALTDRYPYALSMSSVDRICLIDDRPRSIIDAPRAALRLKPYTELPRALIDIEQSVDRGVTRGRPL
mgnify:CR=1 FL=1